MAPGGENSSDGSNGGYLFSFWSSSWEVRPDALVNLERCTDASISHHTQTSKDEI